MANLKETAQWEAGIYQLETSDPVMGGADGVDNRQAKQLGNRTLWLKGEVEDIKDMLAGRTAAATDKKAGIVKLINTLTSTATDTALTAAQGKVLNEKIDAILAQLLQAVPSGLMAYYTGTTAPPGWIKANGAEVSRTLYAGIFAVHGTTYGAGDGHSTFNLPDMRGEFVRGWDDGRGIDLGRVFGSVQSDNTRRHIHGTGMMSDTDDAVLLAYEWGGSLPRDADFATIQINGTLDSLLENRYDNPAYRRNNIFRRPLGTAENEALPDARSETRPHNIALLGIIKI